jgi:hypothetical protein
MSHLIINVKVIIIKFAVEQTMKAQKGSRSIAVFCL